MKIGDKIKFVRELRGYKQDHVAKELGISQNGYGKIERGETDVPYSRLEQLSKVFEVKIEDLVGLNKEQAIFSITNHQPQITTQAVQNQYLDNHILMQKILAIEARLEEMEKKHHR